MHQDAPTRWSEDAIGLQVKQPGAFPQQAVLPQLEAGSQLLTWEQVGQQAGEDVLQGYQLLPGGSAGGPRAAPSRVLPTEKDAQTDKAVLLYRDTDGWCPFCERVSWRSSPGRHHQLQGSHLLRTQQLLVPDCSHVRISACQACSGPISKLSWHHRAAC